MTNFQLITQNVTTLDDFISAVVDDALEAKGIFGGDGAGNFDWQKPITREQVASVLYRTLEAAGLLEKLPDKK